MPIPTSFALAIMLYREIISCQMNGRQSYVEIPGVLFQNVSFMSNSNGSSRLMDSGLRFSDVVLPTVPDVPTITKRLAYCPNIKKFTLDGGLFCIFCFGLVMERLGAKQNGTKLSPILALGIIYLYDLTHENSHLTVYFSFLFPVFTLFVLHELWSVGCFGFFYLIQKVSFAAWTMIIFSMLDLIIPKFSVLFLGHGGLLFLCSSTLGKKISVCPKRVVSIMLFIFFAVFICDHHHVNFRAGRLFLGEIRKSFVLYAQAALPVISFTLAFGCFFSLLETANSIISPPIKSMTACSCMIYNVLVPNGFSMSSIASACLVILMFMGKPYGAPLSAVSLSMALAYVLLMILILKIVCTLFTDRKNQSVFQLAVLLLLGSSLPTESRLHRPHILAAQTFGAAMIVALSIESAFSRDKTKTMLEGQGGTILEREAAVRRLREDCERRASALDAERAALQRQRALLDAQADAELQRRATQAVDAQRTECRRLEAEPAVRTNGLPRHRQQADSGADAQLAAAERRRIAAAAADADARLSVCRRAEAGLNTLRSEVERQRTLLASEKLGVASSRQRLAEAAEQMQVEQASVARAAAQLEAGRRDLERQRALLEDAKRWTVAEQRRLAALGDAVEAKWAQAARLDSELESKRRGVAQAEAALAEEKRRVEAFRLRLTADASALSAEQEQGRQRLRLQEERLEAQRQAQAAVDMRLKEALEREERVRAPPYWLPGSGARRRIEPDPAMVAPLQARIRQTVMHEGCAGAPLGISRARVTRVLRVENRPLWALYQARRAFLRESLAAAAASGAAPPSHWLVAAAAVQPGLERVPVRAGADELVLWHGTSHAKAQAIAEHGFDPRAAEDEGLYGAGCYFTDLSCKAHQYSARDAPAGGEKVLMVCRVTMGWACPIIGGNEKCRRAPMNPDPPGRPFDSIFGKVGVGNRGKQVHNEFVLFEGDQAYPEYLVYYVV